MTDSSTDDGYIHSRLRKLPSSPKKERLWLNYGGETSSSSSRAAQILGAPQHGLTDGSPTQGQGDGDEARAPTLQQGIVEGDQSNNREEGTINSHSRAPKPTSVSEPQFDGLDELNAPSPFDEEAAQNEPHLEDQSHSNKGFTQEDKTTLETSQQSPHSRLGTELYTLAYLTLFSLLGTLARLGLQALTFYPGAPVQTGLLWANVSGSLIMGFLSEDRRLFREEWGAATKSSDHHAKVKKSIPLYVGLATGFCGSFTSFSSFVRDAFFAMANALPVPINHPSTSPGGTISQTLNVPRNGGYSFMALLAVAITTIGLSLAALQLGAHIAVGAERWVPGISLGRWRILGEPVVVLLAAGGWVAAIVMAAVPPDRPGRSLGARTQERWRGDALFALVFAPPGCILRFYISKHLNPRVPSFPLGTFAVNIVGCALEAIFIDLQRVPLGGRVGCQVLQGMSDGFCGCLTTVSTWVAEIKGLRLRHGYVYAGVSFLVGLAAFVVITGSLMWTHGFAPLVCGS